MDRLPDARAVLDGAPYAVVVLGGDGLPLYANSAAAALLELASPEQVLALHPLDLVRPSFRPVAGRLLARAVDGRPGGPVAVPLAGDADRWLSVSAGLLPGGEVCLAITDGTAAERLRHLQVAFEHTTVAMAVLDADGRFLAANAALAELVGRPRSWFPGRPAGDATERHDPLDGRAGESLRAAPSTLRLARHSRRPDGSVRDGVVSAVHVPDGHGSSFTVLQVSEATERREAEQRQQRMTRHDRLTDLPGRGLLLDRLDESLLEAGEGSVAVLMVDLDHFGLVNEAFGHAAGDSVLVAVGQRISSAVRPDDLVGRLDGDEFLVVCRRLADRAEAFTVARRVERAVARPVPHQGEELRLSASVGVAFSGGGASPSELVREADEAMFRAKQLGTRRFEVFDRAMRERAAGRARIEGLLRRAVSERRLVTHYQPVVELSSGRVVGLEALARLLDDDGTLLPPAAFLDVADESGVLAALDDAVLAQAVAEVARLRDQLGVDLTVSVNVSAARIAADLPGRVLAALAREQLPAHRLVLEITEQTLVAKGPGAEGALAELHAAGVHLALDDFGTGWASLTYLRRFPVDVLKIDRSFVTGISTEHQDRVIVRTVIGLSRELGLLCTAEGVETEQQRLDLQQLGAHHGQGFLFGRPTSLADLPALLAERQVRPLPPFGDPPDSSRATAAPAD